jgi:hypothetical protein
MAAEYELDVTAANLGAPVLAPGMISGIAEQAIKRRQIAQQHNKLGKFSRIHQIRVTHHPLWTSSDEPPR